ncbi:flavin monoamine oxidase family protein [Microbacterium indicum]|uniref:flavin monoamine oxidase family protein n=1 Tax=Microbacterium indicum TaxID=358100 RepID=UPI00056D0540|nr:FAD-dependent oxidoreductase [Microbacterium indicum]
MRITRRTFVVGAGAGALAVLLASCRGADPAPSPSPTASATPSPTPSPTESPAVPEPSAFVRSRWSTDPFALGARSAVLAGGVSGARATLAEPIDDRLFFAGEAYDEDAPGTVAGALQSGYDAAQAVSGAGSVGERFAVIGAGAAGAAAGQRLAAWGFDVTVIEARDRPGGRIASEPGDEWGVTPQLGPWILGAGDASLSAQLPAYDVEVVGLAGDDLLGSLRESAAQAADGATLAETVDQALPAFAALTGADPQTVSAQSLPAWPVAPYEAVTGDLTALAGQLLDGVDVTYSTSVTAIFADDRGVSLRFASGESLSFDRVVVTLPVGVLQKGSVEFDPPLSDDRQSALDALDAGAIEYAWLRYDEPIWDDGATFRQSPEGPIRLWVDLREATGEPILVGVAGADDAREFAAMSDDDARAAALASLAAVA